MLPLLLTMAVALLQVGLFVKDQLVVVESARAAARQAAVSTDDDSVRAAAQTAAVGLDSALLSVSVQREGGSGTAVTVTVTYESSPAVPLVDWLFPASVQLSSEATMRQETG